MKFKQNTNTEERRECSVASRVVQVITGVGSGIEDVVQHSFLVKVEPISNVSQSIRATETHTHTYTHAGWYYGRPQHHRINAAQ